MKRFLPLLALCVAGCTLIPTQHGTAQFWGDYENVSLRDGAVTFTASKMTHSGVVRAHWHGATAIGAEVVAFGAGGPVMGAGTAAVTSFVNRPTNRTPAK